MKHKERLDVLLVSLGLAESRAKAQATIMAGEVRYPLGRHGNAAARLCLAAHRRRRTPILQKKPDWNLVLGAALWSMTVWKPLFRIFTPQEMLFRSSILLLMKIPSSPLQGRLQEDDYGLYRRKIS